MSKRTQETKGTGTGRLPLYLLLLLVLSAGPSAVDAQQAKSDGKVDLVGFVKDGVTGDPMSGVLVEIEALDRNAFTNKDGRFVIRDIKRGSWTVRARQLGYEEWVGEHTANEAGQLNIELQADPVLLEEIRVVSDRIERRRKSTAMSVFAYEADELSASAAFDVTHFVRTRVPVVSCPVSYFANDCVLRRGRPIVPRVYIDEVRLLGGFEFLGLYNPSELYLIEVYDSGSQIRLYTKAFAERLALGQEHVFPILSF